MIEFTRFLRFNSYKKSSAGVADADCECHGVPCFPHFLGDADCGLIPGQWLSEIDSTEICKPHIFGYV